jgi:replication factor C large subunit
MSFVQKYKPKNLKEFINQKESVEVFLKWMSKWKPGSKALLFYGMPGVGKTALIHAYANEKNFEFIEMNASDFRSAQQIQEVFGQSMKQLSLFKKSKIFLIDEIDGIAGRGDLGGVGAVIKIIKESRFPVVLTANDPWNQKLRTLRQYCQLVQFGKISVWDIQRRLKEICEKEKIKIDGEVLRQLAKMSEGDLRSAMNDLETISQGKKEITVKDLEILGYRERGTNIFEVLRNIFKTQTAISAKLAINSADKDPDEIFWWIENNITNEYEDPEEIAKAFDALSKADIFKKRIISRQHWGFKAYMIDLMTAGVSSAKKQVYKKFTRYQYPQNIMILGRTKGGRLAAGNVIKKLSISLHCSNKKIRSEFLPYFKTILKNKQMRKQFIDSFGLQKEDLVSLKKLIF